MIWFTTKYPSFTVLPFFYITLSEHEKIIRTYYAKKLSVKYILPNPCTL
jgi:hypothetical protein